MIVWNGLLVAGVVVAFAAFAAWTGSTFGSWVLTVLVHVFGLDTEPLASWLWRVAVALLLVGSVGKVATGGF